jgi:hypothetical protein
MSDKTLVVPFRIQVTGAQARRRERDTRALADGRSTEHVRRHLEDLHRGCRRKVAQTVNDRRSNVLEVGHDNKQHGYDRRYITQLLGSVTLLSHLK